MKIVPSLKEAGGDTYVAVPVRDGREATRAVLHLVLNHTADMFHAIVDIICEKHGINKEEIMETIQAHPRITEMVVSPVLHDLGYIEPAAVAVPETDEIQQLTAATGAIKIDDAASSTAGAEASEKPKRKWSEEAKKRAAEKRAAKKAAAASASAVAGPESPAVAEPTPVPAVKKIFKIKPKAAAGVSPISTA